jgi:hypothetical protein
MISWAMSSGPPAPGINQQIFEPCLRHERRELGGTLLVPRQARVPLATCETPMQGGQVGMQAHKQWFSTRNSRLVAGERGARLDDVDQDQARCARRLVARPDSCQVLEPERKLKRIVWWAGVAPAQPVEVDQRVGLVGLAEQLGELSGNGGLADTDRPGDDQHRYVLERHWARSLFRQNCTGG